ncbi:MAG: 23S rRNA (pseudouridine(1915)-N(3))-methyltransferase RlmH [Bacilli bacterium]|nr:23S rRNA (pseudouridine(1915)-N(3))-methyltransferase RlmH [Bacilli bacterium]
MMIKIICVGNIKEKYFTEAIKEYLKRISKFHQLDIIEVEDVGNNDKITILRKEKEKILKYVNKKDYIITLEIDGNEESSIDFANRLNNIFIGNSNITFIIGGSYGLDAEIKKLSNYKLSFSKMTFPHQLFRVILLEQIYRAFKINNNEEYHK